MSNPRSSHDEVAPFYDLHAPKNVPEMLDFFAFAVKQHASREVKEVFELGIGTGRFAIPLAQRGYRLSGNDGSAKMLDICRKSSEKLKLQINLKEQWFQDFAEVEKYDAVVAIFTAIGFLVEDEPIRNCLQACLNAVRPGGFVLIDVPNSLQGLTTPWAGCHFETFAANGMILERFLEMIPHSLKGIVTYRDRGIIYHQDGSTQTYKEEFFLKLFSLPLLKLLLEPLAFKSMTCYCNWTDREPMQPPYERLILVLEK